jgi:DNA-binding CsgD family transcriptional regulator
MDQKQFSEALGRLTPQQWEVLSRVLVGEADSEIADSLGIKSATVRKHIERIYRVFDIVSDFPDDRRSKRGDLFALFAKYKPELLRESTSITIDQVIENSRDSRDSTAGLLNPFVPQFGRVDDPKLFFDREREIRRVFEILNSGSSVALIGEEGIGKSSLLWKICQLAKSHLHSQRQPIFLDLNWVNDENDFYSALCHEVGIPESKDYSLTRNLRDRRVLLAIDNVGKMTWEGFTRGVRDRLRGLAEGSNAPLKLILAANEPLDDLFNDSQDESKTSPLSGICQEENLKPWDEATARAFIEARLAMTSVRFTEEEVVQLVQESGGYPQRLMRLCYQTYSRYVEGGE